MGINELIIYRMLRRTLHKFESYISSPTNLKINVIFYTSKKFVAYLVLPDYLDTQTEIL